ncbi:Thiamin-phosphate pyrophosphorylase [Cystobacter fuscus DSM 2262]|uniref:Thiamine-phosphate synthase n=1 Tax=Cystobacter fuscus (strain ATCC 25194 / DSM 2262 / NBRC 100088 / M29) TaxID=1242864 RepID=S9PQZ3_CYSF2|nr:thiamine phosphate synthase [Cystobacter fuscus]EPX64947.1 Thiamin-phosphate pyrophosphorylase [Cystobacter fuscus DSM 2262]
MSRRVPDLSVYLVTDRLLSRGRGLVDVVLAAVRGGATLVQLRDKDVPARETLALGRALLERLRPLGVPLIVNDRVDLALAMGADGVHVGQGDLPPEVARRLLGPDALVGLSITGAEDLPTLDPAVVDYAGVGPIFPTGSKPDATPALGLEELVRLRRLLPVPAVAIGGISAANAAAVVAAGADGVSVVSAICSADDCEVAASTLVRAVREGRARRGAL